MATIINRIDIEKLLPKVDVLAAMEEAFTQYSLGNSVVPPVGELLFDDPKGDVHIKYGYIKKEEFFVVKVASGFYENPSLGIPSSQGLMLLFSSRTGQVKAILLDEGILTDVRTAAAGLVAAKYFAPKEIMGVGIIGTGIQAHLQLEYLRENMSFDKVWVWGRSEAKVNEFLSKIPDQWNAQSAPTPADVAANCNLIVTTTPSAEPLLSAKDIRQGTHITAVGSDTAEKQELESGLVAKADLIIVDSIPQSKSRGEIYRATKDGMLSQANVVELGATILDPFLQRSNDQQISIVDLTGVAVQDIMITSAIFKNYNNLLE